MWKNITTVYINVHKSTLIIQFANSRIQTKIILPERNNGGRKLQPRYMSRERVRLHL